MQFQHMLIIHAVLDSDTYIPFAMAVFGIGVSATLMIWLDSAIPFDRVPSALLRARPRSPVTRARGNYVTSFASWLGALGATSPIRLPPPVGTGDQVEPGTIKVG